MRKGKKMCISCGSFWHCVVLFSMFKYIETVLCIDLKKCAWTFLLFTWQPFPAHGSWLNATHAESKVISSPSLWRSRWILHFFSPLLNKKCLTGKRETCEKGLQKRMEQVEYYIKGVIMAIDSKCTKSKMVISWN